MDIKHEGGHRCLASLLILDGLTDRIVGTVRHLARILTKGEREAVGVELAEDVAGGIIATVAGGGEPMSVTIR